MEKGRILDELCATTGWHRNHARKALGWALRPRVVRPAEPRAPRYGAEVITALAFCWAVLGAPAGKRLAPIMGELVPRLRRFGELDITEDVQAALLAMSPGDDGPAACRRPGNMALTGRSHTKPGSLLKSQIPIRTWAQWDDAVPGFVEIDLVGHEGGNAVGDHCYTLTVTDIATAGRRECSPAWGWNRLSSASATRLSAATWLPAPPEPLQSSGYGWPATSQTRSPG